MEPKALPSLFPSIQQINFTLGSYAYSLMRAFPMANQDIRGIQDEFGKTSVKVSHFEYRYVSYLESLYEDLEHSFKNMQCHVHRGLNISEIRNRNL